MTRSLSRCAQPRDMTAPLDLPAGSTTHAVPDESAVTVFVGAPASGKTSLRRRLVDAGLAPSRVVSLDDLRRTARTAAGEPNRRLQDFSLPAMRAATDLQTQLLSAGLGYLADATNLRRRERVAHVNAAHAAGLRAVALLLPALPVEELAARDRLRTPDERVPDDVLAAFAHRRSLLTAALLSGEGFDAVYEVDASTSFGLVPADQATTPH
jgi:predicted kinase